MYGDKTGKLLDPERVIKGRLTKLKHMNDHHVYDWIDEVEIPKGTMVETSRWLDDLKPYDGDENSVRSRIVVQQYNVDKRFDVHQGTSPLKVLRMLLALATSKDSRRQRCAESGTSVLHSFTFRWMNSLWWDYRWGCECVASYGF